MIRLKIKRDVKLKRGRRKRALIALVAVVLAWPFVAWAAAIGLVKTASLRRADALVVLSGSSAYVERTRRAAELYREGRAPRVILTNDNLRGSWSEERRTNPFFVERAHEELLRAGVPETSVEVLPGAIESTFDEAVAVRDYAVRKGLRVLLFVTSAYHTRRALWTLRKVFDGSNIEVGIEAVEPGLQMPKPETWWLSLRGWRGVALEYPKLAYYFLKYR